MITKCKFCNYQRETPLSEAILEVLSAADLPEEDYSLWVQRLVMSAGTKDWNSVKIHMGRMHKTNAYVGMWPRVDYSERERTVLTKQDKYATL